MRNISGQVLILVLLVVVVALSVGLSVASRNITNLRTSTQTQQSQRAFSAAEGGIEDVLSRLSTVASGIPVGGQTNISVPVGDLTASVNVAAANTVQNVLEEGTVGQVNLTGYSGNLTVQWILQADTTENTSPKASLELTFVCQNATPKCFGQTGSGAYAQYRVAYQSETNPDQTGFTSCTLNPNGSQYYCSAVIANVNSGANAGDNVLFVRIKPFWRKATVQVTGSGTLPVQAYILTSTARTADLGITRRVQVTRSALPQLPASFDYALFSEGDINK